MALGSNLGAAIESPIARYLRGLHARFADLADGQVATYIPELGRAVPGWFGICVATVDGHVYEVGVTRQPFTIQSISKPFVYGLALEDRGKETVLRRIGVEPTGDAFNEVSLEPRSGRPLNPMINAGAIASTAMVAGRSREDQWERIRSLLSIYAGRSLSLDHTVYESERSTGHRNRAIGHMLRNFDIIEGDVDDVLDLYFRQCSVDVNCRDLSLMAATLANGGKNPITHEQALSASNVDEVLSIMTTCGMYDYAGEWLYRVGMPAKSGVSGGILAVLPGRLGIAVYSPPLDARGNSVRGVAVCKAISDDLQLHFLRAPAAALVTVRSRFTLATAGSRRDRSLEERRILSEIGHRAVVYRLQGELSFCGIEPFIRRALDEPSTMRWLVVDLTRAVSVDTPAADMLLDLIVSLQQQRRSTVLVGLKRLPRVLRFLEEARLGTRSFELVHFDDLDYAIEWCEARLLDGRPEKSTPHELPLAHHSFFRGFEEQELSDIVPLLERRQYRARQLIVQKGDPADELYLLVHGEVSVLVDAPDGTLRRIATMGIGTCFGEPAMLVEGGPRTASVRADEPTVCWTMHREVFQALGTSQPSVKIRLLENLMRSTARILSRSAGESLGD